MNCKVFGKLSRVQSGSLLVSTLPEQGPKASAACKGVNPGGWWDGGRISLDVLEYQGPDEAKRPS